MTLWFTSDWHFGHRNILTLGGGRPFATIEEHDEALIKRHNALVVPTDRVLVLGDVAMGRIEDSLAQCQRMKGRKVLVCGNHDRPAMASAAGKHEKAFEWIDRYRKEGGFDGVWLSPRSPVALTGHITVAVSHYPYYGDSSDQDRFVDRRPADKGLWLLHGHVHHAWKIRDRMINVGVDAWDYAPVRIDTIISVIQSSRQADPHA